MTTITTRTNSGAELTYGQGDANLDLDIKTAAADPSAGVDDNRAVYECTGTFNFTLPAAATIVNPPTTNNNDFQVTVKNVSTGVITVKTSGADTLDGVAAPGNFTIAEDAVATFQVNNATDGYVITSQHGGNIDVPTVNASTELQVGGTKFHSIGLLVGSDATISALGVDYTGFTNIGPQFSEGGNQMQMPIAGVIKNLHTYMAAGSNTLNDVLDITVSKNGVPQSLTVQYLTGTDGKKSDVSNSFSVAKGDLISVVVDASAASSGLAVQISFGVEVAVA